MLLRTIEMGSGGHDIEVQISVLAVTRGSAFVYIRLMCVYADRAEHTGIAWDRVRGVVRRGHPTDHKKSDNFAEKYARPKFWSGHGPTDPTGSGGHEHKVSMDSSGSGGDSMHAWPPVSLYTCQVAMALMITGLFAVCNLQKHPPLVYYCARKKGTKKYKNIFKKCWGM